MQAPLWFSRSCFPTFKHTGYILLRGIMPHIILHLLCLEEKQCSVSVVRELPSKLQPKCMPVLSCLYPFVLVPAPSPELNGSSSLFFPSRLFWNRAASQPSLCYGKQALLVSSHLIRFPLDQFSNLPLNWGCSECLIDLVQSYSFCCLNKPLKQQKYFSVFTRNASPDQFSNCICLFPWLHHTAGQSFGNMLVHPV